jgi:hypothetical protein
MHDVTGTGDATRDLKTLRTNKMKTYLFPVPPQQQNKNSRGKKRGPSSFMYPQPQQQNKNSLGKKMRTYLFPVPTTTTAEFVPRTTTINRPKKKTYSWIRWAIENHHLEHAIYHRNSCSFFNSKFWTSV